MSTTSSGTLGVPGASLYYEVCGAGPFLLLIHAGGGDGRGFNGIADRLAGQYSVVSYDRRRLSRSKLDDPEETQRVETHSDDAYRLLQELGGDPAYVFGNSGGAVIGLDLAARHPELVRTLVAHEPPSHLLPEEDNRHDRVREMAQRSGAPAALQQALATMGIGAFLTDTEPDVVLPTERPVANIAFLIKHEFAMYDRYWLDFDALRGVAAQTRIVVAGGQAQREAYPYRSALAVAEQLGSAIVEFPGGHAGYVTHPRAFAARLQEVLGAGPAA